jgi:hypothetical protein
MSRLIPSAKLCSLTPVILPIASLPRTVTPLPIAHMIWSPSPFKKWPSLLDPIVQKKRNLKIPPAFKLS